MRITLIAAAAVILAITAMVYAQQPAAPDTNQLIANALSAAPPSIAAAAKVMLMDGTELRRGTNGWTCFPDDADVPNNSPMCLDAAWLDFFEAYMHRRTPTGHGVGIGYMLQGDMPVSNIDPFATGPTPDNEWLQDGVPHIMLIVSDTRQLESLSQDPHNGGPWIMWKDTPYAHVMVPTVPRAP
ncbi:MAG: hypothetical protein H0U67_08060 [Gemmatimonadetes bacterium]|nr:hypothetical protein [Gemmatimonadota bacterium]